MSAKPLAHVGSPTQHTPVVGTGMPNVLVNNLPVWTVAMPSPCPIHGPEAVGMGSETVKVKSMSVAREGDFLQGAGPPNRIMVGSPNVSVGSPALGLAQTGPRTQFCQLQCALQRDWPKLTPLERRKRYDEMLASMSESIGMPAPTSDDCAAPAATASWSAGQWQVNVGPGAFEADAPPPGYATFHELRHGEQSWMALRSTGGVGAEGVPREICQRAADQPLDPDSPEGRFGALHADNEMDPIGLENRAEIIREIGNAHEAAGGPTGQRYADAVDAYRHQPGGADARDVEGFGNCVC